MTTRSHANHAPRRQSAPLLGGREQPRTPSARAGLLRGSGQAPTLCNLPGYAQLVFQVLPARTLCHLSGLWSRITW